MDKATFESQTQELGFPLFLEAYTQIKELINRIVKEGNIIRLYNGEVLIGEYPELQIFLDDAEQLIRQAFEIG